MLQEFEVEGSKGTAGPGERGGEGGPDRTNRQPIFGPCSLGRRGELTF